MTGHGATIRRWRLQRFWVPGERLSVDVAFNHESDSYGAAMHVLAAALGESALPTQSNPAEAKRFVGTWIDAKLGLLLDVTANQDETLSAFYDGGAEVLSIGDGAIARGLDMTLSRVEGGLRIQRHADAIDSLATPINEDGDEASKELAASYHSEQPGSDLEIVNAGDRWFAGFRGFLGTGPLMPLAPVGKDLRRLTCMRSLDAPAPGDWTVQIKRSVDGRISGVGVRCWSARSVTFQRA